MLSPLSGKLGLRWAFVWKPLCVCVLHRLTHVYLMSYLYVFMIYKFRLYIYIYICASFICSLCTYIDMYIKHECATYHASWYFLHMPMSYNLTPKGGLVVIEGLVVFLSYRVTFQKTEAFGAIKAWADMCICCVSIYLSIYLSISISIHLSNSFYLSI